MTTIFETPIENSNLKFQSSDGWIVSHIEDHNVVAVNGDQTKQFAVKDCLFFNNAYGYGNENRPVSAEYAVLHNNNGF